MNQTSTQTWADYLDITEVAEWLQFPSAPTGSQEMMLSRVISMACTWTQNYCNRPIAPTQFQERHMGWSGDTIMLRYFPFIQLVSATEWQSSGGPVQLLESTPENPIDGIQINYATSQVKRTFAGYSWNKPFFPGSRNIEFTYIAGFNPLPPDIWIASVEMVAHWWRNTQQASRTFVRDSDYDPAQTDDGNGLWQGVPYRIVGLLDPYRRVSFA